MLLDDVMPVYDVSESHRTVVDGPPERVYAALWKITLRDLPLGRLLLAIRSLPARPSGRGRSPSEEQPLLAEMLDGGFVLLAEERGRELVVGTIGQFWKARGGGTPPIGDAGEFVAFDQPGFAKAAMNFHLADAGGTTELITETRVLATDPGARRKFGRYWLVIRAGSGAVRGSLLRAVRRRTLQGS